MARDADSTRRRILSVALALFREHGFEATTMRRIAEESGLSLGAAYHHFASKQAIVAAFYEQQIEAHEGAARSGIEETDDLRERLGIVMHTALDVRGLDRKLLRELAPLVVGPDESLSAFSAVSGELRTRSIRLYREAVEHPQVPEDLRDTLALALWALSMGILLYFANDESPRQKKTRALVDGALDLTVAAVTALSISPLEPVRKQLAAILREAGLLAAAKTAE
jgi:AcrR family transcriptional regulator